VALVVSEVSEDEVVIALMVVFTALIVAFTVSAVVIVVMVMVTPTVMEASAVLVLSLLAVVKVTASTLVVLAMADSAMDTAKEDVSIMVAIKVTQRALEDMVNIMVDSALPSAVAMVLTDPEVTTRGIELLTSQAATNPPSAPIRLTLKRQPLFPMVTTLKLMVAQLATMTSDMQAMASPTAVTTLTDAHTGEYAYLSTTAIEERPNMKFVSIQHIAELFPVNW